MSTDRKRRAQSWVYYAALIGTMATVGYYLVAMLYIVISRIRYPFSLDFVEGDSVIQVLRILRGQALYVQPSYRYVALDYPPLYFYVSAVFSRLLGPGFYPLRLLSFISALGCIALIYLICRKDGCGLVPSLLAAGVFVSTYKLVGTWFDIARVDMLALFLLLLAVYLARLKSLVSYTLAGVVFALSCLTKQTNLLVLVCLDIYFLLFKRRKSFAFMFTSMGLFAGASFFLDRLSAGWYSFYVFTITFGSGGSALSPSMVLDSVGKFWLDALFLALPIAMVGMIAYLAVKVLKQRDMAIAFYAFFTAGMLAVSWAALAHPGGADNVLLPAYAAIAILSGLTIQEFGYARDVHPLAQSAILAAFVAQLIMLYYPLQRQIPTHADLLAGQALLARIQAQKGSVYVPFHPELPLYAGKPTYADWVTTYQLEGGFGGGDASQTNRVKTQFVNAMANQEFSMIILDKDLNWVWGHPERHYYFSDDPVFSSPDVFWPVTGWRSRPTYIMLPIEY